MKRLKRYIYRNLVPARLMNSIDIFSSLRGAVNSPVLIEKPTGSRVLVLAPHPDDEIYGCGGVLHKHHQAGDHIVAVYMTDGRKGGIAGQAEDDVARERQLEAKKSAAIIGINHLVFMNHEDDRLQANNGTISQLAGILNEVKPDIVYLPFLLDYHPDHIATNSILMGAMAAYKEFMCYGYEVWTPLLPNCYVDISEQMEIKQSSLEQFTTQTSRFDMVGASFGLGKYRSVMYGYRDRIVESFFRCTPDEYSRLWELVKW